MEKIGRIKYTSKGAYSPEKTYTPMNVVLFEGSLWECLKETTGNTPPDHVREEDGSIAENEFWRLFLPGALGDDYIKKTNIAKAPTETEPGKVGVFFPDGKTLQINEETGELTGTPIGFEGTWKELQDAIKAGEAPDGTVGYIKGADDEGEESDPDHPYNLIFNFDDFLSTMSANAPRNYVVADAVNAMKALIEQNAQLIEETKVLRASLTEFGLGKICPVDVTDITEANGIVLGGSEKNPTKVGSLAYEIAKIKKMYDDLNTPILIGELTPNQTGLFEINLTENWDHFKRVRIEVSNSIYVLVVSEWVVNSVEKRDVAYYYEDMFNGRWGGNIIASNRVDIVNVAVNFASDFGINIRIFGIR